MSKNHLIAFGKLCSLVAIATGGLMMASCAEDGFDENERFESKVSNTQLVSPTEYTLTTSADGKSQTVVWPVVYGAGGYQVSLYDASNMEVALVDSLVEGCSVTFKREEDVNYVLKILTKGNAALGNTDASEASQFTFSTFTPTFQTIPAGSDLNQCDGLVRSVLFKAELKGIERAVFRVNKPEMQKRLALLRFVKNDENVLENIASIMDSCKSCGENHTNP